jgi:trehalose/maltose transport system permease protein
MTSTPIRQVSSPVPALFSLLFVLLGISGFVWLWIAASQNPGIQAALGWTPAVGTIRPSLLAAFLTQFGIVLPMIVLGLGAMSIGLGMRLRARNIVAARWADVALAWLGAIGAFLAVVQLGQLLARLATGAASPVDSGGLLLLAGGIGAALLFFLAKRWLSQAMDRDFHGQEALQSRETRLAWMLLIPTLAVFFLVAARPLEQTFIRSLTDKRFASSAVPTFVGLQNYRNLLGVRVDLVSCRVDDGNLCLTRPDGSLRWESIDRELLLEGFRTVWTIQIPFQDRPRGISISALDADFIRSVQTTLVFVIFSVSLELLIALFMAMTVNSSFAGRGLMRTVMLVPWAIPTVVSARLWELMMKDSSAGIVNRVLMDIGLIDAPRAWLSEVSLQLPTVIMVDAWKTAPFMALLLLAGLQSISKDLYEAADVDGAGAVRKFLSITLPLLRPTIAVALVFRTLDALRVFDLFNVLFGRQQLSMATYNYETLVNNQQDGYASAVSIILFLLISIFAVGYMRALKVETD